jgi:hypothetical protein
LPLRERWKNFKQDRYVLSLASKRDTNETMVQRAVR